MKNHLEASIKKTVMKSVRKVNEEKEQKIGIIS